MSHKDPEVRKAYKAQWYQNNREAQVLSAAIRRDQQRERNREFVRQSKLNKPCVDCGLFYPPYVMDYDHLGEKVDNVSSLASAQGASIERIQQEIDKCDLVCSNCHRQRTHDRSCVV